MSASIHPRWVLLLFWCYLFARPQSHTLYILHTNNNNGTLENCYCPDHPLGSIEKRVPFVDSFEGEHTNVLLMDAGDFLSPANHPYKDSLVCEGYKLLHYSAILPGDQELSRDLPALETYLNQTGSPIVATNLIKPDLPGVVPYLIIPVQGIRVAVFGIISPHAFDYYPKDIKEKIKLRNPVYALKAALREIFPLPDVVIVLSHSGYDRDRELAKEVSGIDVIIGGHTQTAVKSPEEINGTLVVQAGKDGYYTGVVTIDLDANNKVTHKSGELVPMTLEMPDDPRILTLISAFEKKTGFVNHRKQEVKGLK